MSGEKISDYYNRLAKKAAVDDAAFEELYREFFPRVYNVVFAQVKNFSAADDIVSEIFEKVILHLENYDEKFAFSTWIFAIARNAVADYFRRTSRRQEVDLDEIFEVTAAKSEQPEEKILAAELTENVRHALEKLNGRQQRILELKYFGGLKNVEIAEVLGLSPSNVGFIHSQALSKLRELLKNF